MRQGLSKLVILQIAKIRVFTVSKHAWQDAGIRKKIRRLVREGLLTVVEENKHMIGVRAAVAQLVQPLICNEKIAGSSPVCGSTKLC